MVCQIREILIWIENYLRIYSTILLKQIAFINAFGRCYKSSNEHYNFETFEYGTVESHKNISIGKNESMDIFKVRGDDNGTRLFEFLAINVAPSLVEFSHIKTGVEGDKGLNFVTTSHDERKDRSMGMLWANQLNYGYTLREINHSHPTNAKASNPDKDASIYINSKYDRSRKPTYNIFFVPQRKYIPFN